MTSIGYEDVVRWLRAFSAVVAEQKDALTELDSAIGDADHGINMHRGMTAVESVLDTQPPGDVGGLFRAVAMKLISTVGGASGPLYGTLFLQMGTTCTGKSELSPQDWATAMDAGLAGIIARGKAEVGDKTMVDAFTPAVAALHSAIDGGSDLSTALRAAADAAEQGMHDTTPLVARKGRASYLGERSAGHQDPGATSTHLLFRTAADTWAAD